MTARIFPLAAFCATIIASNIAFAASIDNADVIKLLGAGMPEEVVLQAIAKGDRNFDTSAEALIKLKEKGASAAILKAVISPSEKQSKAQGTLNASSSGFNPEEVTVSIDGETTTMQYIIPQQRTAARALGFGGVASYAALSGPAAKRRMKSGTPEFIVSVPKNAQASNYVTVARFATRSNDTREVMTGGGYMSYSSGINKSRVIPVRIEALPDQTAAREGFILHKVSPAKPMKAGEYALVLYTGEMRTAGFFAQAANSYFDFGID